MSKTGITASDMRTAAAWLAFRSAEAEGDRIGPHDSEEVRGYVVYKFRQNMAKLNQANDSIAPWDRGHSKIGLCDAVYDGKKVHTFQVSVHPGKVYGYIDNDMWPEFVWPPDEAERIGRLRALKEAAKVGDNDGEMK